MMNDECSVSSTSSIESLSSHGGLDLSVVEEHRDGLTNEEVKRVYNLTRRETRRIGLWRLVVITSLLVTGLSVSLFTYFFLSEAEKDAYSLAYALLTGTVRDMIMVQSRHTFQSLRSFSETITGMEKASDDSFPFITLPDFEVLGSYVRVRSGLETINFAPIVSLELREQWETYSVENYYHWREPGKLYHLSRNEIGMATLSDYEGRVPSKIYSAEPNQPVPNATVHIPWWMSSPPPFAPVFTNLDVLTIPGVSGRINAMEELRDVIFSNIASIKGHQTEAVGYYPQDHVAFHDQFVVSPLNVSISDRPHAYVYCPVYNQLGNRSSDVVAYLYGQLAFDTYLVNMLPDAQKGIHAILANTCNDTHSYELTGDRARYLGLGDLHDSKYDDRAVLIHFSDYLDVSRSEEVSGHCRYTFTLYPTDSFVLSYQSKIPMVLTIIVAATFFFMIVMFLVYDRFVEQRNDKVFDAATRASTIVSSLFPSNVRDRLYAQADAQHQQQLGNHSRLKSFLHDGAKLDEGDEDEEELRGDDGIAVYKTKPIAELFPETTVMFADVAGFSAWSSSREPVQVFVLLETLYHAFDEIAKRRSVFKVETVGDCYVAVAGLPDPRKDHAVAMCRFARDCLVKMKKLAKTLEVTLGPDTGDLSLRIGLHSGPVTAGVLRGERSRFQLFGDTMNVTSRMESCGARDRIQLSQETADLLINAGKETWFSPREDKVLAKGKEMPLKLVTTLTPFSGKGELSTYWLLTHEAFKQGDSSHTRSDDNSTDFGRLPSAGLVENKIWPGSGKVCRLVDWNVDVLTRLLKQIVAKNRILNEPVDVAPGSIGWARDVSDGKTVLDEVKETIALPPFHAKMAHLQEEDGRTELDPKVKSQLREYVSNVASLYHDNPFHNFAHASHVAMSVVVSGKDTYFQILENLTSLKKLLSRIVAPVDVQTYTYHPKKVRSMASQLHDHTYGITSDPLTQFSCVFSALIHDVDHPGIPNSQLIKENLKIATFYKNKSVAEQNSVDLAWDMLQDDAFSNLRSCIHPTKENLARFRQLVVNSVMATDIMDNGLKALRNRRWERAFSEKVRDHDARETVNRKATIVIEHLIQASDVAHTMQHWHVYRKWNERLFFEMYKAYAEGRSETDPGANWYKGELGFFDFYIIPLAKKLKECGVFGVSSDEYLNYAEKNRAEWASRGQAILQEMIEKVRATYPEVHGVRILSRQYEFSLK